MSHNWNHVLEDNDDKEEYVELKEPHHIQAILRAEQDQKNKAHQESILKIIDEKPTEPAPLPKQIDQKPKFIEDDRERVYPNQKPKFDKNEEKTAPRPNQEQKAKIEPNNDRREQKKQKKQYRNKQQQNPKQTEPKKENYKKNIETRDNKAQSSQKKKVEVTERSLSVKKTKYVEKQGQKKHRKQTQFVNGEQITLEFDEQQFQNEIYVGKKDASIYFQRAKQYIKDYEFIVIKSYAIYVSKAVLVAGLMAKEYPQLKQINIPSTIQLKATSNQRSKLQTRGAIRIELSLHSLKKNHIGYQESSKANPQAQKQAKKEQKEKKDTLKYKEKEAPKYEQKETPKYKEKKPVYVEKQPSKKSRRERQGGSSEQDERHLR